jgi:hypothetical protein
MSEERKSAFAQAKEALARTQKKVEGLKERGETLMSEVVRTAVGAPVAFGAGALEERYGVADAETGIRTHKVNGANTSLLGGLSLKVAAGLGLFGKVEIAGFAAGDGAINHSMSTWGRMAGARLRIKAEKSEAGAKATEPANTNGKAEKSAKAA